MTTHIAKKSNTDVSLSEAPAGAWGSDNIASTSDALPKALIVQAQSNMLKRNEIDARPGEIRDSLEGKLLGNKDKPFKFIPFFTVNTWVNSAEKLGKMEFVSQSPRGQEEVPYEETIDGVKHRHEKALNVYVLPYDEISKGEFLPLAITFKGRSFKAAKTLEMLILKLKSFNLSPATRVFSLTTSQTSNLKGNWYIFEVAKTMSGDKHLATTPEEQAIAYKWYQTVSSQYKAGTLKEDVGDLKSSNAESFEPASSDDIDEQF